MRKLTSSQIRQMWLDFFKSKGHSVEPSASLVPHNDPSLLWTNAGVTPLKKYFDGSMIPDNPRITNAQKCLRTNDIENVGHTARHHTFFEMLGNFSIGDYFKSEAIKWATELLFEEKWFGFAKDKLYITYYYKDLEAKNEWMRNGVSEDHLIPLEGNFWEIGEGPCGPDTEMFFDRGEKYDKRGKELIEQDIENDRFIEIWNIVFSQFNSKPGVKREDYEELPSKNIDTGAGLERLACVMQGVDTNYDTDLFVPLLKKIEEISGVTYNGQMAFKVIADHVRTVTFAISDGATLSNEGRGYVLRRVLRRATKYAKQLGINKPFMSQLVDSVIDIMGGFYPYLLEKVDIVKEIITREEEKFLATISNGEKKFETIAANTKNSVISGEDAFLLYDTYGFPLELTMEYAQDQGLTVDIEGFKKAMEEQKQRARSSRKTLNSMGDQNEAFMKFTTPSEFIGYDTLVADAKVIKVFKEGIILDKTPFYAFSGGQLCDKGFINGEEVIDCVKLPNGQHLHVLAENNFKEGDMVHAIVDANNRALTAKNHSSCHLLQKALQVVLGDHVHQHGSQVGCSYARFDFNNYQPLTDEELIKVEDLVNEYISLEKPVITHLLPIEEAKKLGAMALFGEKYGAIVRVVDMDVSKEFCGGTHVKNTKDISKFMITSYESIGSGIYRISGVTSENALDLLKESLDNYDSDIKAIVAKAKSLVNEAKKDGIELSYKYNISYDGYTGYRYILQKRAEKELASKTLHELEKTYQAKKSQKALKGLDEYLGKIENKAIVAKTEIADSNLIKDMATSLVNDHQLKAVVLISGANGKVVIVAATDGSLDAVKLVREASGITGGGGGGKNTLAQAGGKDASKIDLALAHLKEILK